MCGASVKGTETDKKNKNNSDPIPFEKVDNNIVQGRHCQDQEWKSLTPKQRAAVIRLRRTRASLLLSTGPVESSWMSFLCKHLLQWTSCLHRYQPY